MKSFYITGSTAGLYPAEIESKFRQLQVELKAYGATKVTSVAEIANRKDLSFSEKIDIRMKAVNEHDCTIFFNDWKDSIESVFEFKQTDVSRKEIRFYNTSDIADIRKHLNRSLSVV